MIWYIRDIRYKKLEKNIKLDDKSCKLISKMIQNSQKFEITPNGLKMFVWKKLNVAIVSYSLYITFILKNAVYVIIFSFNSYFSGDHTVFSNIPNKMHYLLS